ncbi:MAG: hypothetical protein V7K36_19880 [Nostoc sp.]
MHFSTYTDFGCYYLLAEVKMRSPPSVSSEETLNETGLFGVAMSVFLSTRRYSRTLEKVEVTAPGSKVLAIWHHLSLNYHLNEI